MSYSRKFKHGTDKFNSDIGTPQDPRRVSFWSNHVRLLIQTETSYCKVLRITTPQSNQVNFSLQAFNEGDQPLGMKIIGDFPCPNNCQPPNALEDIINFDIIHIKAVLDSQLNDPLFDIALSIRDYINNTEPNSLTICSNSYNPNNPTGGGGPRRTSDDKIFISL